MVNEFTVVGKNLPRVDAASKVTGQAVYFSDFKLTGMLYGLILRSPLPHARIISIDTEAASNHPGVLAVVTAKDAPPVKFGYNIKDESIFAGDKVRYVGDEVAAVAALDLDTAQKALELIRVVYEELPAVYEPAEALSPEAPLIHDRADNLAANSLVERGPVDELFAQADYVFDHTFRTGQVHPSHLEPFISIAAWEGEKLNLWAPYQNPFVARGLIAQALKVEPGNIRLHHQLEIGGGFGGKLDSKLPTIAGLLARKAGRPVRIINSREDELSGASRMRVNAEINIQTAVKKDGTLLAKKVEIIADNGAYSGQAPKIVCTNMAIRSDNLYRLQGVRTISKLVYTNKIPTGAFRGYGNPQMHFAVESQMDIIAERLGMDPIELRLKNAVATGDVTIHGWEITSGGLKECLEKVREASGWDSAPQKKYSALGVACMIHVSGNRGGEDFHGSEAIVKIQPDGKVQIICAEVELGQGSWTVLSQIAAEELGVPLEQTEWVRVDTDTAPFIFGAYSSRTTHIAGNAIRLAARDAKNQISALAAKMLKIPRQNIRIRDGIIGVYDDSAGWLSKTLTMSEVVKFKLFNQGGSTIYGHGSWDPGTVLLGDDKYGNISSGYPFGAQVAEVEVDPETGKVNVLRIVAAHDVGKAIHPVSCEGQIEGGVAQGIGYSLLEEIKYKDGKVQNNSFLDYQLPTIMDVPPIDSLIVETFEPQGPFGAKGLGEPTLIPVAPAIANAVYRATGVRFQSLPISPQQLAEALDNEDEIGG